MPWNASGFALPPFADEILATLGQAVVPLCLVLIGVSLAHYGIRDQRYKLIYWYNATLGQAGALPGAREVTVCFADLVGFTRLGEQVAPDELGRVAHRLVELTAERLRGDVRLVKTIGDAAMLVGPDAHAMLALALDLVDAADAEGEDYPQLRVGMASGAALSRAGDWYGRPVNLASRLTAFARRGSVVATGELREYARADVRWSFAGNRRFKGVAGEVAVYRVRRTSPSGQPPP